MRLTRDEHGFTLTELLVTIVILGVIILPLGNAVIGFIRLTDDTTSRLNESHDVQLAAAYFPQDVQSVGVRDWSHYPYPLLPSVELDAVATAEPYRCGPAGTPVAAVRLAIDDPPSAGADPQWIRIAYVVSTVGTEQQLHRLVCQGSPDVISDIVVAHNIAAPPAVACYTAAGAPTNCDAAPAVPATITMTLSVHQPNNPGPAVAVVLTGARRQT